MELQALVMSTLMSEISDESEEQEGRRSRSSGSARVPLRAPGVPLGPRVRAGGVHILSTLHPHPAAARGR